MEQAVIKTGFSVRQASESSDLSETTIRRAINAKALRAVRFGKKIIIPAVELEKFIQNGWDGSSAI